MKASGGEPVGRDRANSSIAFRRSRAHVRGRSIGGLTSAESSDGTVVAANRASGCAVPIDPADLKRAMLDQLMGTARNGKLDLL